MKRHIVDDDERDPETLAEDYKCPEFSTTFSVLGAARVMIAGEISTCLPVRSWLREIVRLSAVVNVVPTERGKTEIDEAHEYYVSWIVFCLYFNGLLAFQVFERKTCRSFYRLSISLVG
jgi:transcriptional accessory protein Tex/SPT6